MQVRLLGARESWHKPFLHQKHKKGKEFYSPTEEMWSFIQLSQIHQILFVQDFTIRFGFQGQSNKIADFSVIIYHTLLANLLTFQIIHLIWDNLFCVQITSSSPQWLCNFIYYNQLRGNSAQRSMLTIFSSKCFCGNRITTAEKTPLILYMSFRVPDFERWYVNFSRFSPVCTKLMCFI